MREEPFIPKGSLKLVFGWVGLSVIVVLVAVMMNDRPELPGIPEDARQVALVTFGDTADGGMIITSENGETILPPETSSDSKHGFVRGVLRALARERQVRGVGPDEPFVLAEEASGRFAISDPATGTEIDLRAFGKDNTAAFASLMPTLATQIAGEQ